MKLYCLLLSCTLHIMQEKVSGNISHRLRTAP